MHRFVPWVAMVAACAWMGCGDSDDGGSTTRSICQTTCERALECFENPSGVTLDECTNECFDSTGSQTCDEVNQDNLNQCLSEISSATCTQLEFGSIPSVCNFVCLVRISSIDVGLVTERLQN